jgi:hypothetical protein
MSEQAYTQEAYTYDPSSVVKFFVVVGIIGTIIGVAILLAAVLFSLYLIWTIPLLVLVDHVVRIALIGAVVYVVVRLAAPVVPFLNLFRGRRW